MAAPTDKQLHELWNLCRTFVEDHEISCAEATAEDRVYEQAPELVERIGKIVGYYVDPDDVD